MRSTKYARLIQKKEFQVLVNIVLLKIFIRGNFYATINRMVMILTEW